MGEAQIPNIKQKQWIQYKEEKARRRGGKRATNMSKEGFCGRRELCTRRMRS